MAVTNDWMCPGALPLAAIVSFAALDRAATLMAKHQNQARTQMIDRILDAAQAFIIDHVSRDSNNK